MSPLPSVRVYGPSRHISSFVGITRGACEGLEALGCLAGFFPTDSDLDEETAARGGAEADVGLMFGVPNLAAHMLGYARHKLRFCVVAPNSTMVPEQVFRWVKAGKAELLAPTAWAQGVLKSLEHTARVGLLPHGVPSAWATLPPNPPRAPEAPWNVLHVTSTASDRKGTMQAVRAFTRLVGENDHVAEAKAKLWVLADERSGALLSTMIRSDGLGGDHVQLIPGRGVPWAAWPSFMRQFSLVLQPSRAEGFGLTPLESLCLGVPVCATRCTGHGAFLLPNDPAVMPVAHGADADIADGDGAMAPSVEEDDVLRSLSMAFYDRVEAQAAASRTAQERAAAWAWPAVLRQWLTTHVSPRLGG